MADIVELLTCVPVLREPRVLRQLTAGPVSDKWVVLDGEHKVTVRVDRPVAAAIGLDRRKELQALERLAAAGCCPAPLWADAGAGVLVLPWLDGVAWTAADYRQPRQLERLAGLLYQLHSAPVALPPLQLADRAHRYARAAGEPAAVRRAAELAALLQSVGVGEGAVAPCHNDAVAGNVLDGPALQLIDFEYAAANHPLYDLAAVIEYHGLDAAAEAGLVAAYRSAGGTVVVESLSEWKLIYRKTAELWSAAVAGVA